VADETVRGLYQATPSLGVCGSDELLRAFGFWRRIVRGQRRQVEALEARGHLGLRAA